MKDNKQSNKNNSESKELSLIKELSIQLSRILDKVDAFYDRFDKTDLNPKIDLEEVFTKFRKEDINTVDNFCSDYLQTKMEKGLITPKEAAENFKPLRRFLYEKRRNGDFKYPFKG